MHVTDSGERRQIDEGQRQSVVSSDTRGQSPGKNGQKPAVVPTPPRPTPPPPPPAKK